MFSDTTSRLHKQCVTFHAPLILHLHCRLDTGNRQLALQKLSLHTLNCMWKRKILGHHAKLLQHCSLIPTYVFMVQSIAADVDYGMEGDSEC